jgi:hypothetical protein
MTHRTILAIALCASTNLLLGACAEPTAAKPDPASAAQPGPANSAPSGAPAEPAAPVDPKVAKAIEIADAIEASPTTADAVLERHGLDREGLDALMLEIAANPELAASYREGRAAG